MKHGSGYRPSVPEDAPMSIAIVLLKSVGSIMILQDHLHHMFQLWVLGEYLDTPIEHAQSHDG